jgi:outer membrane receptor protein involved in Fe transport
MPLSVSARPAFHPALWLSVLLFAFLPRAAEAQTARIAGTVRDTTGAPVPNAKIALHAPSYSASTASSANGNFAFEQIPASSGTVTFTAPGFRQTERAWTSAETDLEQLEITLNPAGLTQQVTVTARTPTPYADSPTSEVELTQEDLAASPNLTLDDTLRQVPGFSLYRRSSSRVANPTTQGVSLRGLGASGASRALVLEDGIPINDPFGGWVYWDRIPYTAVQSIEVSQEGGSSLYGNDAMGGVVEFFTRSPEQKGISLETSYGNQNTPDLSLWAGGTSHGWEAAFAGEVFHTDGYILVPEPDRGSVDTKSGSQHGAADLTLGRRIGTDDRVFARGWFLSESRDNGTPDQINDTRLAGGALGADLRVDSLGSLALRAYAEAQTYHQTFSSIAPDRDSETLTDIQSVPSQGIGGSAVWSKDVGRQTLVAGVDSQEAIGHSDEQMPLASKYTVSGGHQRTSGVFGEDLIRLTPTWSLSASARYDHWSNFDAFLFSAPLATPTTGTTTPYPNRSYDSFSPRLSVVNHASSRVWWSASIYRGFRAPTLNEFYRSFRQGNVLTESNPNLSAEHLTGGEAGVVVDNFNHRLELRATAFVNEIIDPVANVTLSTTPTLITRQRQNLGRTRAPGVEIDGTAHIVRHFQLVASYQYVDAIVTRFPGNSALVGLWIAQVPHHVVTFQAQYENPSRINFSVDGRMVGLQYDDDQNQFPMGRFFVLDMMAWRGIRRGVELFVAGENLLNAQYETAATPVPQIGLPIAVRTGLRIDLPQR